MPKFNVRIVQVFRAQRSITIEVEAESLDDAIDKQEEELSPAMDDPRWRTEWNLMNEEVTPA